MRQFSVLMILLLGMGSALAQDGLILHEPGIEEGRPIQQNDMSVLPLEESVEIRAQDCDSPEAVTKVDNKPKSLPASKPKQTKPKAEPKNDPEILEWLFKKHKMPSLHFIDLLEMID